MGVPENGGCLWVPARIYGLYAFTLGFRAYIIIIIHLICRVFENIAPWIPP